MVVNPTDKLNRYLLIPIMYKKGRVVVFRDLFKFIRKTHLADDLGMKTQALGRRCESVGMFTYDQAFRIAGILGLSYEQVNELILNQWRRDQSP